MSSNTSPVWIKDPANVGITDPTYPSMKLDTQLITRYYGTNVVSQGQVTIPLTTANITGMYATPVTVLPSPGQGYALVVNGFIFALTAGGTQFNNGGGVALYYGDDGKTNIASGKIPVEAVISANSTVTNAVQGAIDGDGKITPLSIESPKIHKKSLMLWNETQAFSIGNGSAKVTVLYSVITL